ncbi:galactose-binding domain-like protein [Gaertneriomyces semiglobifer]|nr:galactose-binding domain-like protein [Gaertneriomyces semiglobifer]
MSGCRPESHCGGHDHGGHGGHNHDHDHDHDGPARGDEYSLYQQVDIDNIRCLNESEEGTAKQVFKSWDERFDGAKFVESDIDEQLLIIIPFTANIKLKSISILTSPSASSSSDIDSHAPSILKAYINADHLDFSTADSTAATQEWELVRPSDIPRNQIPEYPTRIAKFSNVKSLALYIPANFGAETTRITYIGLKGEWTKLTRDPVITIYEAAANPADHKTKADEFVGSMIQ